MEPQSPSSPYSCQVGFKHKPPKGPKYEILLGVLEIIFCMLLKKCPSFYKTKLNCLLGGWNRQSWELPCGAHTSPWGDTSIVSESTKSACCLWNPFSSPSCRAMPSYSQVLPNPPLKEVFLVLLASSKQGLGLGELEVNEECGDFRF